MNKQQVEGEIVAEVDGFASTVTRMRWMSLVIVYLGMLMVNQFFAQWSLGRFGADGFANYLTDLQTNANIDRYTRDILGILADNASILAPLLAIFVAVTGLACMLLLSRPVAALVVSAFFWILWYITSATSGIWTFEYFFPAIFGLIAGLATLPLFTSAQGRSKLLGPSILGRLSLQTWIAISVALSVTLAWFFTMAESGGPDNYLTVSLVSGIALAILLVGTGVMDKHRHAGTPPKDATGLTRFLQRAPWPALMILIIGSMMTIQVFADVEVGWFDVEGYSGLISQYAQDTGAPWWWSSFLNFVADHAAFFMPLQAIAEFSCAFFLVTLLIRPITLVATFGFFFTLMFSEFGVSATVKQGSENTWEWEMLFVTGVLLMLAIMHFGRAAEQTTWKHRILGDKFFNKLELPWQLVVAFLSVLGLWSVGTQTKMFGSGYATISLRGALFFFGCLMVLIVIERFREPESWNIRTDRLWAS